jgi:hypothetical protein
MDDGRATNDGPVVVDPAVRHTNKPSFLRERSAEVLGLHYQMAWPIAR